MKKIGHKRPDQSLIQLEKGKPKASKDYTNIIITLCLVIALCIYMVYILKRQRKLLRKQLMIDDTYTEKGNSFSKF